MIKFINVYKKYNNSDFVIKNLNFTIMDKEFVFIVGPSGAGKSTILKLITREENVTSGKIIINDTDITQLSKKEIPYLRRTMGIVFQDFKLIEKMSVYENVSFAMNIVGASQREIRKRVPYVLNLVGLSNKARCKPFELSGGERQRVGMARALANNPQMIVADEPTGNIDATTSHEIVELLKEINNCGTTILMVTHDREITKKFNFRKIDINKS